MLVNVQTVKVFTESRKTLSSPSTDKQISLDANKKLGLKEDYITLKCHSNHMNKPTSGFGCTVGATS